MENEASKSSEETEITSGQDEIYLLIKELTNIGILEESLS